MDTKTKTMMTTMTTIKEEESGSSGKKAAAVVVASASSRPSTDSSVVSVEEFGGDEKSHLLLATAESDDEDSDDDDDEADDDCCVCKCGCHASKNPTTVVVENEEAAARPRDRMRALRRQLRASKLSYSSSSSSSSAKKKRQSTSSQKTPKFNNNKETLDFGYDWDFDYDDDDEENEINQEIHDLEAALARGKKDKSTIHNAAGKSGAAEPSATKPKKPVPERIRAHWHRRLAVLIATKLLSPFLRKGGSNTIILPNGMRIKRCPLPNLNEAHAVLLVGGSTPVPVPEVICAFVHRNREAFTVFRESPGVSADAVWEHLGTHHRQWLRCRIAEMLAYLHAMPVPDTPAMREVAEREGARTGEMVMPPRLVFAHGDFKLENVILDPWSGEVVALVDWERAGWYPAGWDVAEREFADECCPPGEWEGGAKSR